MLNQPPFELFELSCMQTDKNNKSKILFLTEQRSNNVDFVVGLGQYKQ